MLRTLVGAPGFEPGASCAQGRRATRLRYAPTCTRDACPSILKHQAHTQLLSFLVHRPTASAPDAFRPRYF
jgi:hypothetical protein